MQRRYLIAAVLAVFLVVASAAGLYFNRPVSQASSTQVQVVAAETFWDSPSYVNQTIHAMYSDLVSVDSTNAAYYGQQYASLNASLGQYNSRINEIAAKYAGRPVASTESIFVYLAEATQLNLISPPEF